MLSALPIEFSATPIVAHLIGDYILQSHWMATNKRKSVVAAMAHAVCYSLPFLAITMEPASLAFICATHLLIDHYGLARYLVFVKNLIAPPSEWRSWSDCSATGYPSDCPPWLAVWLMIIADNTMHIICNQIALSYWG
jgi:hypothetical protein